MSSGTSGILFALAIAALVIAVVVGVMRRNRGSGGGKAIGESPNTVAQWTEGETTRLLSSAELPGLYLLRPLLRRLPRIHKTKPRRNGASLYRP